MRSPGDFARFPGLKLDAMPTRKIICGVIVSDDHRPSDFGNSKYSFCECITQMDAAVRGWISRQSPCMERHSVPGEAFGK